MAKNKVIHARMDEDTHDKLLEKCNEIGCNLSDYVVSILDESLDDYETVDEPTESVSQYPKYNLNLNYGKITDVDGNLIGYLKGFTQQESEAKIAKNTHKNKEIPEAKVTKVSYDSGKSWINV